MINILQIILPVFYIFYLWEENIRPYVGSKYVYWYERIMYFFRDIAIYRMQRDTNYIFLIGSKYS